MFNGWTSTSDGGNAHGQQGCRSYHLCNAATLTSATVKATHCPHAEGKSMADAGPNTFCAY
jgi:hypothetical protein